MKKVFTPTNILMLLIIILLFIISIENRYTFHETQYDIGDGHFVGSLIRADHITNKICYIDPILKNRWYCQKYKVGDMSGENIEIIKTKDVLDKDTISTPPTAMPTKGPIPTFKPGSNVEKLRESLENRE